MFANKHTDRHTGGGGVITTGTVTADPEVRTMSAVVDVARFTTLLEDAAGVDVALRSISSPSLRAASAAAAAAAACIRQQPCSAG